MGFISVVEKPFSAYFEATVKTMKKTHYPTQEG